MLELTEQARAWLDSALEFAMESGLDRVTLRPLAARLGTSDRMLIYHFGSKERLVEALAWHASERLATSLGEPRRALSSAEEALAILRSVLAAPASLPFVRLYFEMLALAMRDPDRYQEATLRVTDYWIGLVARWLDSAGLAVPRWVAAYVLATLEGLLVLRLSGEVSLDEDQVLRLVAASLSDFETWTGRSAGPAS